MAPRLRLLASISGLLIGVAATHFAAAVQPENAWAVRIVFGTNDKEQTDWSGKIVGAADPLDQIQIEPWRFATGQGDSIQQRDKSWKVQTRLGIAPLERGPVQVPGQPTRAAKQIPWPVGVIVFGRGAEPERLAVETVQGNFEIKIRELRWGLSEQPRDGVRAERSVPPSSLDGIDDAAHYDFPALLVTRQDQRWLAAVAFRGNADRVISASMGGNQSASNWSNPEKLTSDGDHAAVTLAEGAGKFIWAIWSQQVDGNWDLYTSRRKSGADWSQPIRLTDDLGPDLDPAVASCPDGSMVLAWRGFRNGQSDIFARRITSQADGAFKLEAPLEISTSKANHWHPSISADSGGRIHIAWDSYAAGNYDVLLRSMHGDELSQIRTIATTPLSETQASTHCDQRGRVWIAYDEGTAAWGKDYGFWAWFERWPQGTRLYERRRFRLRVLDGERLMEPPDPFDSLPTEFQEYSEQPIMRVDHHDRPWVFFRHRTAKNPREDGWAAAGWWELYAIYLNGEKWSDPIPFSLSMGRQSQQTSVAPSRDGFSVAWATDGRTFAQPADGIQTRIHTGFIDLDRMGPPGSSPQPPVLQPYSPPDLTGLIVRNVHADEPGDVQRIRDYSIAAGGKKLRIYRGDLHRHTEISSDGVGDGTLTDLYRYALDAAAMDFIMVTDHGMGADRDYPWWRTQKSNDMYHLTSRFVPMYGYERSIRYPWGHRNVIWTERGHKTLPQTKGKADPETKKAAAQLPPADDDTEQLHTYLRKNGGIATLHTSASDQGTNWETGFDPQLEPFVEIFQGYHTSYEGLGTPLAIDDKTAIVHGPYKPAGFVWNALEKGYRLGFQASSDHIATHNSYACVLAESLDRRSLVAGMKARHSYAATDNIILDVRSGDHIMGDEFTVDGPLALNVKVHGTAPLASVEIIHDKQVVYSHDAKQSAIVDFSWSDMQSRRGDTSYYYVRVQQVNRQMAWSSPMWVNRK